MREDRVFSREAVVGAIVGKVRVRPDLPDYLHRLPEQFAVLVVLSGVGVGMELGPLVGPDSPAKPDFQPAPGHVVQDGQVLGQQYRVPPRSDVRHLADADSGGAGRQVGAQQYGIREVSQAIGAEVMFSQPHGLEPQFLGEYSLLSEVVQHVGGVGGLAG